MKRQSRYGQQPLAFAALGYLVYLLAVIVFGAYVRATGAGAGCGSHWPLCNGEVVPSSPQWQTLVEYTHRLTSGLCLPLALLLVVSIWRRGLVQRAALRAALWTVVFVVIEGLLGAGLVYFEHVAGNTSVYRPLSMGLHLLNTFALVGFATVTWHALQQPTLVGAAFQAACARPTLGLWLGGGSIVLLGVSGAVTALGDTIFPVSHMQEALAQSWQPQAHWVVKMRIYHPLCAVLSGCYLLWLGLRLAALAPALQGPAIALAALVGWQLLLGVVNIQLHAPVWLQLTHLLFAQLLWVAFVKLALAVGQVQWLQQPQPLWQAPVTSA